MAQTPRVSICLPNLNNRPFLDERLDTIFRQSFSDWELVIFDNDSQDGAWELFQEIAARDDRVRLQRAPNRVRVNAQLINAQTDAHLWAETYDRDLADVFAIQSEIAKAIADQLQAKRVKKRQSSKPRRPT